MARVIDVLVASVDEMRQNGDDVVGIALTFDDSQRSVDMLNTWIQLKRQRGHLTELYQGCLICR